MLSVTDLIDANDLTREDVDTILEIARSFEEVNKRPIKKLPTLRGRTIINLFLEPSTRTRSSFEIAGKRLSADTINISGSSSAVAKGESLEDTVRTLGAMDSDMIIVRHKYAGAPAQIARVCDSVVVNAGDGKHQHPSQALLDIYTLVQKMGDLEGKRVAIVGDNSHSRVTGSLVPLLKLMGAQPVLIAPPGFMPARPDVLGAEASYDLDAEIPDLDVVYLLRVQMERMDGAAIPSVREYARFFGIDRTRQERMKEGAVILHPGPMNRGVEISSDVADSADNLVLHQVNAGVAVRMAIMYLLLGGDMSGTAA